MNRTPESILRELREEVANQLRFYVDETSDVGVFILPFRDNMGDNFVIRLKRNGGDYVFDDGGVTRNTLLIMAETVGGVESGKLVSALVRSFDAHFNRAEGLVELVSGLDDIIPKVLHFTKLLITLDTMLVEIMKEDRMSVTPTDDLAEYAQVEFGIILTKARKELKLTQKDLADKSGFSRSYIAELERGEANPTLATIGRLLAVMGFRLVVGTAPLKPEPMPSTQGKEGKMKVLNKRTDKIPPDAVYVSRPSKWGNPFKMNDPLLPYGLSRAGRRKAIIDEYRKWILEQPDLLKALPELKGKDLVCYCSPLPCHADILLELANKDIAT